MPAKTPFLGRRFCYNPKMSINSNLSKSAQDAQKRMTSKIESQEYEFEDHPCYCLADADLVLSERDCFGNYYPFVICKRCGLMRSNPRLSELSYLDFYARDYRALYGDNDINKEEFYLLRNKQAEEIQDFIYKHIRLPAQAVVFDIGCNMGTALSGFAKAGCTVMGVDYDEEYIKFGRKKTGLRLEVGGIDKFKELGQQADLVMLNHVFEHIVDIRTEVQKIRALIKPGGYLYVSVPGTFWWTIRICRGDIMGLLQNAHLWQFSLNTLKYIMEDNGLKLIFGDEQIRAIFKNTQEASPKEPNVPEGEFKKTLNYFRLMEVIYLSRHFASVAFKRMSRVFL